MIDLNDVIKLVDLLGPEGIEQIGIENDKNRRPKSHIVICQFSFFIKLFTTLFSIPGFLIFFSASVFSFSEEKFISFIVFLIFMFLTLVFQLSIYRDKIEINTKTKEIILFSWFSSCPVNKKYQVNPLNKKEKRTKRKFIIMYVDKKFFYMHGMKYSYFVHKFLEKNSKSPQLR